MDGPEQMSFEKSLLVVNKIGYSEGAAEGQAAVYQSSFDQGFAEGITFGIKLSQWHALNSLSQDEGLDQKYSLLKDPTKINCQICLNSSLGRKHVTEIDLIQKQNNLEYLKKINLL